MHPCRLPREWKWDRDTFQCLSLVPTYLVIVWLMLRLGNYTLIRIYVNRFN